MQWTKQKEDKLRKLHGTMPVSQIAKVFGVTKNTITGRCRRLNLKLTVATNSANTDNKTAFPLRSTRTLNPLIEDEPATEHSKTLMQLQSNDCRYPQTNRMYCAQPTVSKTYCLEHYNLCVAPAYRKKYV